MRNRLFVLGSFADDPQSILTGIQRLAVVGIERGLNLGIGAAKLRTTAFTDGEGRIPLHDSQLAFRHENSLAPDACESETAPAPSV
jgi:hypothetical protein